MICLETVKKYCKDYTKIENYEKAISDNTQVWNCHHRLEQVFTRKQLIIGGNYYDVEPECLIFLTKTEHNKLHHKNKVVSKETRQKQALASKGNKNMLGKTFSKEHKEKISISHKGKTHLEDSKRKMSDSHKGKHWKLIDGKRIYY